MSANEQHQRGHGGWFRVDNSAMDRAHEIGPVAFVVYVALARFANGDRQCFPSAKTLADSCGITKRSVWKAIKILEQEGWIRVQRTSGKDGNQGTNLYTLATMPGSESNSPPSEPDSLGGERNDTGVVNQIHQGGERNDTGVVNETHHGTRPIEPDLFNQTKGTRESATADDAPADLGVLIEKWNKIEGVCHCRAATASRKKAFKARAADPEWLTNLDTALDRVAKSDFCRGISDRGWKADIDFFLRPDSLTKILEGKYDNVPSNRQNGTGQAGQRGGLNGGVRPESPTRPRRRDYARLAAAANGTSAAADQT